MNSLHALPYGPPVPRGTCDASGGGSGICQLGSAGQLPAPGQNVTMGPQSTDISGLILGFPVAVCTSAV